MELPKVEIKEDFLASKLDFQRMPIIIASFANVKNSTSNVCIDDVHKVLIESAKIKTYNLCDHDYIALDNNKLTIHRDQSPCPRTSDAHDNNVENTNITSDLFEHLIPDDSLDSSTIGYSNYFNSLILENNEVILEVCVNAQPAEPNEIMNVSNNDEENKKKRSSKHLDIESPVKDVKNSIPSAELNKVIRKPKVSKNLTLIDENVIISLPFDDDDDEPKRVTRQNRKKYTDSKIALIEKFDYTPGKLVWAYSRKNWWPAIIIKAEDAGMASSPNKVWIFWLGDYKINELNKKHVDLFLNNIEKRFVLMTPKEDPHLKLMNKIKDKACLKITELLRKHSSNKNLTRPYAKWIINNMSSFKQKQDLNQLCFYPYPQDIQEKLDTYKKQNFSKTKKYIQYLEIENLHNKINVDSTNKKSKTCESILEGGIEIINQKCGMVVWAKLPTYNWWPCAIVDYQDIQRKQPQVAHQWVLWYSDYNFSQIKYTQIITFKEGLELMKTKIKSTKDKSFLQAVKQASKDFDSNSIRYPPIIEKQLREIETNQPMGTLRKQTIDKFEKLDSFISNEIPLKSVCIACFENDQLREHPFFTACLCQNCWDNVTPLFFAYGHDSKCFFCTLCGGQETVIVCDNMDCPRVFCTACVKFLICPSLYNEIMNKSPWLCFVCEPHQLSNKNFLRIQEDWKDGLNNIYSKKFGFDNSANSKILGLKNRVRVLSLFDGIGTGLLVLNNLNVDVEMYYASEIDEKAIQVSRYNHGQMITQLGDVRLIRNEKLQEIAPIDLLIGGSPCNDLSLVNPKRRGLDDPEGTGILFYDYVRILETLQKLNTKYKRHLFWLFENVASMPKKYSQKISTIFGRDPLFLDSADFSAQRRPRLYWGNFPCTVLEKKDVNLQGMLHPNCNRQALVKKMMTITTRTNSLTQTNQLLKVVQMGNETDTLWVTEVERIFGYPSHYTDANISNTSRLKLLGKAWSVQTIQELFRSLLYFYDPKK